MDEPKLELVQSQRNSNPNYEKLDMNEVTAGEIEVDGFIIDVFQSFAKKKYCFSLFQWIFMIKKGNEWVEAGEK